MQKIYSIITQFNPYHQDDLWALVVYRTPGESTTRYLVQVEKQLKMVHHYIFFLLTHQIQMFYMLWILEKFLSQFMLFS